LIQTAPFESAVVAEDCSPFFCKMTVAPAMAWSLTVALKI
jgi:hypothetical protein